MKIMTVAGTRPELIRLSLIIKELNKLYESNHIVIYTNQNYAECLSTIFLEEFNIRPDYILMKNNPKTPGEQLSKMIIELEEIINKEKPDKILILGDTYSCLATTIIASRLNIPTYHLEAGSRCHSLNSPEERNRKIIDHSAYINMCYTQLAKENLIREGIELNKIFTIGNPIVDVIKNTEMNNDKVLEIFNNLFKSSFESYFLVTLHRAETVDDPKILESILQALEKLSETYKIIVSTHPRTKNKISDFYLHRNNLKFSDPFNFKDFIALENNAKCIITDSGTVQEEAAIFKIPCVVIRNYTERLETIEYSNTILSGIETQNIIDSVKVLLNSNIYYQGNVYNQNNSTTQKVINILRSNI